MHEICFDIKPNPTSQTRTGSIIINKRENSLIQLQITQRQNTIQIISAPSGSFPHDETTFSITIKVYEDWYIDSDDSFVTLSQTNGMSSKANQTIQVHFSNNTNGYTRSTILTLHNKDNSCIQTITVTQEGAPQIINLQVDSHIIGIPGHTYFSFTALDSWEFFYFPPHVSASEYYDSAGNYTIELTTDFQAVPQNTQVVIQSNGQFYSFDLLFLAYGRSTH